jgi:hypothetical protein
LQDFEFDVVIAILKSHIKDRFDFVRKHLVIYKRVGFELIIKKIKWHGDFIVALDTDYLDCDSEIYMGLLCK